MSSSEEEGQGHSRPLDPLCSVNLQTAQVLSVASGEVVTGCHWEPESGGQNPQLPSLGLSGQLYKKLPPGN